MGAAQYRRDAGPLSEMRVGPLEPGAAEAGATAVQLRGCGLTWVRVLFSVWLVAAEVTATRRAHAADITGVATHYGESYQGRGLGCGGTYETTDASIAAVQWPEFDRVWPCGTRLQVSGPAGEITVIRRDSCGGCATQGKVIDLTEAGLIAVCGSLGGCTVTVSD
jgi:hypothetical protein